jgi:hypothetical protein
MIKASGRGSCVRKLGMKRFPPSSPKNEPQG